MGHEGDVQSPRSGNEAPPEVQSGSQPPRGKEYPSQVPAVSNTPNSSKPPLTGMSKEGLGRTPNHSQQVSGSQFSGEVANSNLQPINSAPNSSTPNSLPDPTAASAALSLHSQPPHDAADDSDRTISVSEDSEFERVEAEVKRKIDENNEVTAQPVLSALRSRYWDAYRSKKMSTRKEDQPKATDTTRRCNSRVLVRRSDVGTLPQTSSSGSGAQVVGIGSSQDKVSPAKGMPTPLDAQVKVAIGPQEVSQIPEISSMYEVFCGSGRMAKAFADKGFQAIGIDYQNKDTPECACLKFDLREPAHQETLLKLMLDESVKVVWFGPPCGTASAARKIRRKEGPDPKELRTDEFPNGKPTLVGISKEKVVSANRLYAFTCEAFLRLALAGKVCILENPGNSLFWATSWTRELCKQLEAQKVIAGQVRFQMCMHGGKRNKVTKLLYANIDLTALGIMCDGSHEHEPWGWIKGREGGQVFATAEERRYPRDLCDKVSNQVISQKGAPQVQPQRAIEHQTQVYAQKQPRRSRPLMPEYKSVYKVSRKADSGTLPEQYKILQEEVGDNGQNILTIGQLWKVEEFVYESKRCTHPFDLQVKVEVEQAEAWRWLLEVGPDEVNRYRSSQLAKYTGISAELENEEKVIREGMHPEVAAVVASKRIALFKRMLQDIQYDDLGVIDYLTEGL